MVGLLDRLDFILGGSNARKLEENFGIRTVNDLLRHYPAQVQRGHDRSW